MTMTTSRTGRAIIEAFEGCMRAIPGRPGMFTTYRDVVGVLTLGYGHTNLGNIEPRIADGDIWTKAQCDDALSNDCSKFEARVRTYCGPNLAQHQFDALVSFDFNTGGLAKSSIPAKIKAGQLDQVGPTLMRWNHAGGKVYAGLTRRRLAESEEFDGKVAEALKTAGTHVPETTPMPRNADRPQPPADVIVKRTKTQAGTVIAGGAAAGGGAATKPTTTTPATPTHPAATHNADIAIFVGLALAILGVVLFVRKYRQISFDWG